MRRLYRRLFEMREFSERNPYVVGAIGIGVVVAAILLAVNYNKVPFLTGDKEYAAYFAEAGGLETNGVVEVSGARIGKVASVTLDGPRVLVKFRIPGDIRLGERTEAAVKVKNFLGTKVIELTPRGEGRLSVPFVTSKSGSRHPSQRRRRARPGSKQLHRGGGARAGRQLSSELSVHAGSLVR